MIKPPSTEAQSQILRAAVGRFEIDWGKFKFAPEYLQVTTGQRDWRLCLRIVYVREENPLGEVSASATKREPTTVL